ncbi:hypothetical protein HY468_03415 [Candidatus Roizmanbacteria bacterium]|nr:hypothetical protein [Candidatus Roizmanbacteria bacterium]
MNITESKPYLSQEEATALIQQSLISYTPDERFQLFQQGCKKALTAFDSFLKQAERNGISPEGIPSAAFLDRQIERKYPWDAKMQGEPRKLAKIFTARASYKKGIREQTPKRMAVLRRLQTTAEALSQTPQTVFILAEGYATGIFSSEEIDEELRKLEFTDTTILGILGLLQQNEPQEKLAASHSATIFAAPPPKSEILQYMQPNHTGNSTKATTLPQQEKKRRTVNVYLLGETGYESIALLHEEAELLTLLLKQKNQLTSQEIRRLLASGNSPSILTQQIQRKFRRANRSSPIVSKGKGTNKKYSIQIQDGEQLAFDRPGSSDKTNSTDLF